MKRNFIYALLFVFVIFFQNVHYVECNQPYFFDDYYLMKVRDFILNNSVVYKMYLYSFSKFLNDFKCLYDLKDVYVLECDKISKLLTDNGIEERINPQFYKMIYGFFRLSGDICEASVQARYLLGIAMRKNREFSCSTAPRLESGKSASPF